MDLEIPRAWRQALAAVQRLEPEAVIAGGCLRDRDHGVKVKDIDIFVPCPTVDREYGKAFEQRMKDDGWQDVVTAFDKTYNGSRISRSIETFFPGCPTVNVVVMPYALIEFDFGICQIEFNGKRVFTTKDYGVDKAAKQFRLIPSVEDSEFIRSLERWSRLKEKYPGWKLNLGSRSETIVPVGGGVTMPQSKATTLARTDLFRPRRVLDQRDLMGAGSGEFVVPLKVAERLCRETTAKVVSQPVQNTVVVQVDDQSSVPFRRIMQEVLGTRDRLMDMQRKAALTGRP